MLSSKKPSVLLPLLIVVASGLGGMLLARHFLHAPSIPTVVAQTEAGAAATNTAASDVPRQTGSVGASRPAAMGTTREGGDGQNPEAAAAAPQEAPVGTSGYVVQDQVIDLVLHRWQEALLSNDAAQIAPSYATRVDRYFLQTGVNRAFVRAYLRGQESRGWRLTAFTLHDISIQHVSAGEVDVRFVAGYAATTGIGGRAGSARTLLKLRPEDGDWKIFYERDFNS